MTALRVDDVSKCHVTLGSSYSTMRSVEVYGGKEKLPFCVSVLVLRFIASASDMLRLPSSVLSFHMLSWPLSYTASLALLSQIHCRNWLVLLRRPSENITDTTRFTERDVFVHQNAGLNPNCEVIVPRAPRGMLENAAASLRYIQNRTSNPVPKVYGAFEDTHGAYWSIMAHVEGVDLATLPEEQESIVIQ